MVSFIQIERDGQTWVFLYDDSLRSLFAFFDVLTQYERDPESGFDACLSNLALRELAHQLFERARVRQFIAGLLNATATQS